MMKDFRKIKAEIRRHQSWLYEKSDKEKIVNTENEHEWENKQQYTHRVVCKWNYTLCTHCFIHNVMVQCHHNHRHQYHQQRNNHLTLIHYTEKVLFCFCFHFSYNSTCSSRQLQFSIFLYYNRSAMVRQWGLWCFTSVTCS